MEGEDFYVTLPSDSSMQRFPNNNGGKFTVQLPQRLSLNSHFWEVALTEIAFNQDWPPVLSSDIWVKICINDKTGATWKVCATEYLEDGLWKRKYDDFPDFIESSIVPLINKTLACNKIKHGAFQFVHSKDSVRFSATGIISPTGMPIRIEFSTTLLSIMGFARDQLVESRYFQSAVDKTLSSPTSFFTPNLNRGITLLMVYTNIIKPHIAGHSMAPLLRIIEVLPDLSKDTTRLITILRPQFYTLNMDEISDISIEIYSLGGGETLKFAMPVICQLQFRRKRPWTKV